MVTNRVHKLFHHLTAADIGKVVEVHILNTSARAHYAKVPDMKVRLVLGKFETLPGNPDDHCLLYPLDGTEMNVPGERLGVDRGTRVAVLTDAEVAQVLTSRVAPTDAPSIFHTDDLNEFDNKAVADNESVGNLAIAAVDLSGRFLADRVAVPTDSTPETITLTRIDHRYDADTAEWWVVLHSTDGRLFTFDPEVTVIALAPGADVQSATRRYDTESVSRIGA